MEFLFFSEEVEPNDALQPIFFHSRRVGLLSGALDKGPQGGFRGLPAKCGIVQSSYSQYFYTNQLIKWNMFNVKVLSDKPTENYHPILKLYRVFFWCSFWFCCTFNIWFIFRSLGFLTTAVLIKQGLLNPLFTLSTRTTNASWTQAGAWSTLAGSLGHGWQQIDKKKQSDKSLVQMVIFYSVSSPLVT